MRTPPLRAAILGGSEPRFAIVLAAFSPSTVPVPCHDWAEVVARSSEVDVVVLLPGIRGGLTTDLPVPTLAWSEEDLARGHRHLEQRLLEGLALGSGGPEARLLGRAPVMARLRGTLKTTAKTDLPLLLTGENGTGKDLAASVAHQLSSRAAAAFVAVNCGAIPPGLAETEFFGCVRGAFTGAENRTGFCQQALGGTLFLDEVGELPIDIQAKLLRVLENHELRRVGSPRVESTDFRLICATNRDLAAEVREGRFREDLYYRINVLPLRVPSLRERKEDLPLLASHFLDSENQSIQGPIRVGARALGKMTEYHWPGNLRQLRNVVLRAAVLHGGPELEPHHIDWDA
jgi:DNA-binding NtrC family response regulator